MAGMTSISMTWQDKITQRVAKGLRNLCRKLGVFDTVAKIPTDLGLGRDDLDLLHDDGVWAHHEDDGVVGGLRHAVEKSSVARHL